jgi:hypothetical protein
MALGRETRVEVDVGVGEADLGDMALASVAGGRGAAEVVPLADTEVTLALETCPGRDMVLEGRGRLVDMAVVAVFVLGSAVLGASFLGGSFFAAVVDEGASDWRGFAAVVVVGVFVAAGLVVEAVLLFVVAVDAADLPVVVAFGVPEPMSEGLELVIGFLAEAVGVVPLARPAVVDAPPVLACEDGVLLPLGGLIADSFVFDAVLPGETLSLAGAADFPAADGVDGTRLASVVDSPLVGTDCVVVGLCAERLCVGDGVRAFPGL